MDSTIKENRMPIPASVAVLCGDTLYFGGVAPLDDSGELVARGDVAAQTSRILDRMAAYLRKAGMTMDNLTFVTVYLPSLDFYAQMNEAYAQRMPQPFPARKLVVTQLAREGMVVEMSGVAARASKSVL
jgi:2-iminobutanoate/2-iminopropanoate deaminase